MAVVDLIVKITSDVKDAVSGIGQVEGASKKAHAGIRAGAVPAAAALAAVGAAAVAAGRAAADDAQGQAVLANTLTKAAGATDAQVKATEDHIAAMSAATGVADDDLRPAMGALALATGSTVVAQNALGVALDVSTATGKDMQSVSEAIAKAYAGNTASLGKLVPSIDKATLASGDMNAIMAALAETTGGSAAAAADTAAGQMAIMSNNMGEAQEEIGTALLPAMSALATALAAGAKFAQEHSTAVRVIAVVVAGLAAAVLAANAVLKVNAIVTGLVELANKSATIKLIASKVAFLAQAVAANVAAVATRALGIAMAIATGPIGIVIAIVALLVAGLVLLYKKNETVRNAIDSAWAAISGAVTKAVSKILDVVTGIPDTVKNAFSGAATWLVEAGRNIIEGLAAGIEAAKAWLMGKVNAIADSIPGWLKKRLGIGSPSKVTAAIGHDVMRGLEKGMADGVAGVKAMADAVAAAVGDAMEKRFKSDKRAAKEARQVMAAVDDETQALIRNAKKRQAVYADLAAARDRLTALSDERTKYAEGLTSAAAAFGAITNLSDKEATTAAAILEDMQARVAKVGKFQETLAALSAAGLSATTVRDLAAAGADAGGAIATGLAEGGPEAIAQANVLQAQLDASAAALGENTAATMYDAGIASAQALVDGLVIDQGQLEARAEELARAMAKAIRKALRKALKAGTGGGGGGGGDGAGTLSVANVVPITDAPSLRGVMPRAAAAPGAVNITVNGAVDPEATARQLRRILAGHDRRVGLNP